MPLHCVIAPEPLDNLAHQSAAPMATIRFVLLCQQPSVLPCSANPMVINSPNVGTRATARCPATTRLRCPKLVWCRGRVYMACDARHHASLRRPALLQRVWSCWPHANTCACASRCGNVVRRHLTSGLFFHKVGCNTFRAVRESIVKRGRLMFTIAGALLARAVNAAK